MMVNNNNIVPGQTSRRQFTSIKHPVTDNFLFLNQQKMDIVFLQKNVPDARMDCRTTAC